MERVIAVVRPYLLCLRRYGTTKQTDRIVLKDRIGRNYSTKLRPFQALFALILQQIQNGTDEQPLPYLFRYVSVLEERCIYFLAIA